MSFTHFDALGRAVMVDVTAKEVTHRRAVARCAVVGLASLRDADRARLETEVLPAARVAALFAAKSTSRVIPLCHPLSLGPIEVHVACDRDTVTVTVTCTTDSHTGVEMEALTGAAFGALAVLAELAPAGPAAGLGPLELVVKEGGRSGSWRRVPTGATRDDPIA